METTAQFASKNGMKTLEQTTRGKILNAMQSIANKTLGEAKAHELLKPLWNEAIGEFQSKGQMGPYMFFSIMQE